MSPEPTMAARTPSRSPTSIKRITADFSAGGSDMTSPKRSARASDTGETMTPKVENGHSGKLVGRTPVWRKRKRSTPLFEARAVLADARFSRRDARAYHREDVVTVTTRLRACPSLGGADLSPTDCVIERALNRKGCGGLRPRPDSSR